jgi:membrane protease YdiL (CAAX protease family)
MIIFLSLGSLFFTRYFFHQAYSVVSLKITMNRTQAEAAAAELAKKYNLGPQEHYKAVIFDLDNEVQDYVELEAGGKKTFEKMLDENLYEPYVWQVRHFMPQNPHELIIKFTPEGVPYGFHETISETITGTSLNEHVARTIAEETATKKWSINFTDYTLIGSSEERQESGRTDHAFTYERSNAIIKDGRYRLKLVVSGDKLSALEHFVYIPEAFKIRYKEMRSANESIHTAASVITWSVYLCLFGLLGLFILLRSGFVIFGPALWWGIGLAVLEIGSFFNSIPLILFGQPTSTSSIGFLSTLLAAVIAGSLRSALLYTITIMAAESLTRRAFGDQVQFWRSWSQRVASSATMVGATLGGYCYVPFDLLYTTGFYFIGTTWLGWWQPSSTFIDPNILATYVPWLSPLVNALQAGFWEECLFRVIPLATAALVGRWFKQERLFVIVALILQALVFGAAHASYPQQPSYFRIVELFFPSLAYGWLYLAFGLVTVIIIHVIYDAVLMSLPLLISTAAGIWLSKLMIVILSLMPVWILLVQGLRSKSKFLHHVAPEDKNSAWQPSRQLVHDERFIAEHIPLAKKTGTILVILGLLSGSALFFLLPRKQDVPYITITREQALMYAQQALKDRNIVLDGTWQTFASICSPSHEINSNGSLSQDSREYNFVWQTGKEIYNHFFGIYLTAPCWLVRYATFEGDLEKRSTQYRMLIDNKGRVQEFNYKVAETHPGTSLEEKDARALAHKALQIQLHLDATTLMELSDTAEQQPARRDWVFTFFDPQEHHLPAKAPRIVVKIMDGIVSDVYRDIDIPEEWERSQSEQMFTLAGATIIRQSVLYAFFILASIVSLLSLARHRLSLIPFVVIFGGWIVLTVLQLFNNWPIIMGTFTPNKPIIAQSFSEITHAFSLTGIVTGIVLGLIGSYVLHYRQRAISSLLWHLLVGMSCGTMYLALILLISYLQPSVGPLIIQSDILATRFVWFGFVASELIRIMTTLLAIMVFCLMIDQVFHGKRKIIAYALIALSGFMFTSIGLMPLYWWLLESVIASLFFGMLYWLILARDRSYIPCILGFYELINTWWAYGINPVPGALWYALVSSIMIISIAGIWLVLLQKNSLFARES